MILFYLQSFAKPGACWGFYKSRWHDIAHLGSNNSIHMKVRYVIIHARPNHNGSLSKSPIALGPYIPHKTMDEIA